MKLKDLKDKRAKLVAELRAMNEKPAGDGGDLSTEQRTRFDAAKAEIEQIDTQIERQTFIDEVDRRSAGEPISGTGDQHFDTECRAFSLRNAIAAQVPELAANIDAGREREVSAELVRRGAKPTQGGIIIPMAVFEQRIVTTALPGGGPGSNLIATDHLGNQYIDMLRNRTIVKGLGARMIGGLVGNVDIPAMKSGATAYWFAENSDITESDREERKVQMTPKHIGARTEISRNMLLQTSPDIEQLIRFDFSDIMAQGLDRAALKGGGANEPDGVLATGGIGSFDGSTWAGILSAEEALEVNNADQGTLGWAMNAKIKRKLKSTLKAGGIAGYIMEANDSLAGYRAAISNNVPSNLESAGSPSTDNNSALIFGNWSDLLIGTWSTMEILVNPYETTAYKRGNVWLRGIMTADIAVRHVESFAADITFDTAA